MIYEKYPELKYKYRNREFWCKGYYVDIVGKNAKKIEEYLLSGPSVKSCVSEIRQSQVWSSENRVE